VREGILFEDRDEAGRLLGEQLAARGFQRVVVLAIPRGGVVVGRAAASILGAPLDVVVPRKIRAPHNPELGLGAVAQGVTFLDEHLIGMLDVSLDYLEREIAVELQEVERRSTLYRAGRPGVDLTGRSAVVVDDGVATGGTAIAALRWARMHEVARVVMAAPVAPVPVRSRLEPYADETVILSEPQSFHAVGQFYRDFTQVSDEEVVYLMSESATNGR
jgi:predicted phosphoribosyltransferase